MSAFQKLCTLTRGISLLTNRVGAFHIRTALPKQLSPPAQWAIPVSLIHTTSSRLDLMEFFDDKKNWGKNEVRTGRAWTADELRLKSNSDLHKLWFVLLKERNMLMTMEHECDKKYELFPNPERLDKVQIAMDNIETVVRERNRAYHQLETGEHGERPGKLVFSRLGLTFWYKKNQHHIPKHLHPRGNKVFSFSHTENEPFLKLLREKIWLTKKRAMNRDRNQVVHLMRRFPNVSHDLLAKRYPTVDLKKIVREDKARNHFSPRK